MEKQPFSNAGFARLQASLYAKDNVSLAVEATAITADFAKWMGNHFDMANSQLQFLAKLKPQALDLLASQTSIAVANRLAVTLAKDEEEEEEDKTGKIIRSRSSYESTAGADGNLQVTGDLRIEICYQS